MGLLEDYHECLQAIETITSENSGIKINLAKYTNEKHMLETHKQNYQKEMDNKLKQLAQQHYAGLLQNENKRYMSERTPIVSKLAKLEANYSKLITSAPIPENCLYNEKQLINKIEKALDSVNVPENTYTRQLSWAVANRIDTTKLTYRQIEEIIDKTLNLSDSAAFLSSIDISEKIIDILTLDITKFKQIKWLSNRMSFLLYCFYLLILTLLVIIYPAIIVLGASIILCISFFSNLFYSRKMMKYLDPYLKLKSVHQDLTRVVEDKLLRMQEQYRVKLDNKYQRTKCPLQEALSALEQQHEAEMKQLKNQGINQDVMSNAKEAFSEKLKDLDMRIRKANMNIKKSERYILSNENQLAGRDKQKIELQAQIKETYLNPKTPGTSKMLTKSFLLGLDDEGQFIEFNYNGEATMIMYRGEDNKVNKPLITKMLMQLLSSMSITSLRITIVDRYFGCCDYAVFSPDKISDRVILATTIEDAAGQIETLYSIFLMRNADILTECESIEAFNTKMLNSHSLTREYYFLFLQDPTLEMIKSPKLQQLCRVGPGAGIIPIIFMSHLSINNLLSENPKNIQELQNFFGCINNQYYIFDGATKDLKFEGPRLKEILYK